MFAAFDLTIARAAELRELLRAWTQAAAAMAPAAHRRDGPAGNPLAPPADTGEALGLGPAGLTLTFGLGPTVFLRDGADRLGLAGRAPAPLRPLGPLPGDELDGARSDGDLCVQAASLQPRVVARHAVGDDIARC